MKRLPHTLLLIIAAVFTVSTSSCTAERSLAVQESSQSADKITEPETEASYTELSARFVDRVIHDKPVDEILVRLKSINPDSLDAALNTDRERLTFWINLYNGFSQYYLQKDPSLYLNDRSAFFEKEQIPVAGYVVSLDMIEHEVLRKGATIWSKGYVREPDTEFGEKFHVDVVDYRIHFALNCGAKSCPPIVVYRAPVVAKQLNLNTKYYLENQVVFNEEKGVVKVPRLMTWFSADFGGDAKEKRAILKKYGIIPEDVSPEVEYLPYDWTLDIENYKSYDLEDA